MPQTSPVMGLPYLEPAQAQKHVTHNEALRILDAVTQLAVQSAGQTEPPAEPADGNRHIVGSPATGAWAGQDHAVAVHADAGWQFFAPQPGWRADLAPTGTVLRFDGTGWVTETIEDLPLLGVNTTADTVNRLAVASEAVLLTHAGAGHQLKINKNAETDTASLLFQTGWSGRAEMGTTGSDDFAIKVSPDGSTFLTALHVEAATGIVRFPQGNSTRERLDADRNYYVRIDGEDSNDGQADSSTGAIRTLQKAVDVLMGLDCGAHDVTINVGPGNYAETVSVSGQVLGSGSYRLMGDTITPTAVKTQQFSCLKGAAITIKGFEVTAANGLTALSGSKVTLGRMHFSGIGTALNIRQAQVDANYATLSFGAAVTTLATMYNYAYLSAFDTTVDLDAGINWGASAAFYMQSFCLVWIQSAQFTGATLDTLGKRYSASINSVINTVGQTSDFIPGSIDGSLSHNSLYI